MVKVEKDIFLHAERATALELLGGAFEIDAKQPDVEYEIRKQLLAREKLTGIYFLLNNDNKLLYVGKSANLEARIIGHVLGEGGNTKRFYKEVYKIKIIFFDRMSVSELNNIEKTFIRSLMPAFNGSCDSMRNSTVKSYGYESLYFRLREEWDYLGPDEINEELTRRLISEWEALPNG